jgi:hypothetical protein
VERLEERRGERGAFPWRSREADGIRSALNAGGPDMLKLLLLGLAIAMIVYVASSGRIVFLPLILLLPLGLVFRGRNRSDRRSF